MIFTDYGAILARVDFFIAATVSCGVWHESKTGVGIVFSPFHLCLLGISLALMVITAKEAGRRGYSPVLWFFGGAGLINLLIVAIFPFVNEKSKLPEVKRRTWRIAGNLIGGVISALVLFELAVTVIARWPR